MTKDLDKLIGGICELHGEVKPMHCSYRCAWVTALITGGWVALMLAVTHVRHDWAAVMKDPVFAMEITGAFAMWVSALLASSLLRVPDMGGSRWLLKTPIVLLGVMAAWVLYRTSQEGLEFRLEWHQCCASGLIYGVIPLALMTFISRKGTTTSPYWMAFMNALAVGSAGWVGLRLSCPMDDVGHGFLYHFVPFVALGSLVVVAARRLFKW